MRNPLKVLVQDYSWIHLGIGLFGNATFFIGSVFFLPALEKYKTWGIWLFIIGAFFMMVGSIGRLLVGIWDSNNSSSRGS
jgi:hypothetical protein